jgi:hypothetical protein
MPSLIPSVRPRLNFAHDSQKTWIFWELSWINLWNKTHFVWKETDIAQCAFKQTLLSVPSNRHCSVCLQTDIAQCPSNRHCSVCPQTDIAQCAFKQTLLSVPSNAVISLYVNGEELLLKNTCKYPCSFTYIVVEALAVCTEDRWKDVL